MDLATLYAGLGVIGGITFCLILLLIIISLRHREWTKSETIRRKSLAVAFANKAFTIDIIESYAYPKIMERRPTYGRNLQFDSSSDSSGDDSPETERSWRKHSAANMERRPTYGRNPSLASVSTYGRNPSLASVYTYGRNLSLASASETNSDVSPETARSLRNISGNMERRPTYGGNLNLATVSETVADVSPEIERPFTSYEMAGSDQDNVDDSEEDVVVIT